MLDRSTAVATALSPYLGYAKTAEIAKESVATGKPIREIVLERGLLDATQLDRILSVDAMTRPASRERSDESASTALAIAGDRSRREAPSARSAATA